MSQVRLNHFMILHYQMTDRLDLKCIANEYIMKNESRLLPFPYDLSLYTAIVNSRNYTCMH